MKPNDLQVAYQRNMLHGLLVSCIISAGFAAWVLSLDGVSPEAESSVASFDNFDNIIALHHGGTESPEKVAIRNVAVYNPYAVCHEGFLGFKDIRPVADMPSPLIEAQLAYTYQSTPAEFDEEIGTSFSHTEGTEGYDTGVYISGDGYGWGDEFEPAPVLADRDVAVVHTVEPEYPFVAQEAGKEGQITVLVYVDSTGSLASFPGWIDREGVQSLEFTIRGERRVVNYAVREEPVDWFFAANFLKVLPDWKFTPRIEKGLPVSSLLRIKCNYCLGMNCFRYESEWL